MIASALLAGILCLTFDDHGIDGWTNAIPLFAKYDAKATFFAFGNLTTNDTVALKALQAAGHSVGLHTLKHRDAVPFIDDCCVETYLREQIKPQYNACMAAGFRPRFFAYPNNRHNDWTDEVLSGWFERFRAGAKVSGYYSATNRTSLADIDTAFFPVSDLPNRRVLGGVGVGEYYHTDIEDICKGLRRAAERDEVLVIFSHDIAPDAKHVSMKTEWLERILAEAKALGLKACGFGDLPPVAPQKRNEPMQLMLTFDDGIADHLAIAAPELEKRGWRGVFSVVTGRVGQPGYLSWGDIRELVRRGHVIANHTVVHHGLGNLCNNGCQDRVRAEITLANDQIERETGVRPKLLCLPGTDCSLEAAKIVRECGMELMATPRSCFGEWDRSAAKAIEEFRNRGTTRIDFLVHGVVPGQGWMPFPSREAFVRYLEEIKASEAAGEVRIVTDWGAN